LRGEKQVDDIPFPLPALSYYSLISATADPPMAVVVWYESAHSRMLDNHDALERRNFLLMFHYRHLHLHTAQMLTDITMAS
jgi:hypothetical protein